MAVAPASAVSLAPLDVAHQSRKAFRKYMCKMSQCQIGSKTNEVHILHKALFVLSTRFMIVASLAGGQVQRSLVNVDAALLLLRLMMPIMVMLRLLLRHAMHADTAINYDKHAQ